MKNKKIGMFDSGVGGLTVLNAVKSLLPAEDIVYFGDTKRLPYGEKSEETLKIFAAENIVFLKSKGIKAVVAACGTISSLIDDDFRESYDIPIIDIISPAAKSIANSTKNKRVGLIATNATINKRTFEKAILACDEDIKIFTAGCPELVTLAEAGDVKSEKTRGAIENCLCKIKNSGVDVLVLGCTHFPVFEELIADFLGDEVTILDPGIETAKSLERALSDRGFLSETDKAGETDFFVSGNREDFLKTAALFCKT